MFLYKFDYLSPEITLFYHGYERHASIFSGILTILLSLFIILLIIILSIDFIFKKNPTAYYYNKYVNDLDVFHLNSSGIFHYIFFINKNNYQMKIDNKAISIIGSDTKQNVIFANNNDSEINHYIYEPCNENDVGENLLKNAGINEDIKENINFGYCIKKYYNKDTKTIKYQNESDFDYPILEHGASQPNNREYGIYIKKCQNNTVINNNSCYDNETIYEYINNYLSIYLINFIDSNIDVQNYKNPIEKFFHNIGNSVNKNSFTINHLNFHPLKVVTNAGIFWDRTSEIISFKFDTNEKLVESVNQDIIGTINFWIQNEMDIYERLYKKLQDIAGGVDGIIEIFMIIIKFFNIIFFNDFQVISDFNYEIEKKIKKYNNYKNNIDKNDKNKDILHNSNPKKINNFILKNCKQETLNNFTLNKKSKTKTLESNTNSDFNLTQNNNNNLIKKLNNENLKIINTITKIEQSFRKISRIELLCGFSFKIMKNNYLSFLIKEREKILSEENLLKHHITLKKLKDILIIIINNKYKNYNERKSLFELDSNNQLKTVLNLSGFLKNKKYKKNNENINLFSNAYLSNKK